MSGIGNQKPKAGLDAPTGFDAWIARLQTRHLANLKFAEVSRALRALSSAYVERRHTALPDRRVLDGAGKRAAFALYYGPLHFLATAHVVTALTRESAVSSRGSVIDLGCGTGAAGAAVAVSIGASTISAMDVHPWTIDEARATYAAFALDAAVTRASVARFRAPKRASFIVAAYVVNELPDPERDRLCRQLLEARRRGSDVLIVEPLAKSAAPWWPAWVDAAEPVGGRAGEWKLQLALPTLVARLGDAAGLTAGHINLRTLFMGG